jgi:hypothetical protein
LDFEATQDLRWQRFRIQLSGGARYAHIAQYYGATLRRINTNNGNVVRNGLLVSGHSFNGVGPTGSIDVSRSLGRVVAVFVNARGSVLFGDGKQAVTLNLSDGDGGIRDFSNSSAVNDDVISVGELVVGGRWQRDTGSRTLFLSAGFASQVWFGAGNAANNDPIAGAAGNTDEISSKHGNVGLIGLKIEGGVHY